jgi:aminoglycoside/choline kinase family phosphotransferase
MHAAFTPAPRRIAAAEVRSSLVRYDRPLLEAAGNAGLRQAEEQGLGSADIRASLARLHHQALDDLTSTTSTLVHGDFYPSNILVSGDRIAVLDWELAGTGSGALDLAALAAGQWSGEKRQDLVRAYHDVAVSMGSTEPLDILARRVDLASVHVTLRWVGAVTSWEPPDEHRRDWFADAVAMLKRFEEDHR